MPIEVISKGKERTVAFAVCRNGRMWAQEFLSLLDSQQHKKYMALFKRMADYGETALGSDELFKHEQGQIWTFKAKRSRIPCFRDGAFWFLTHGFPKKRQKWPKEEFERAERIRIEHIQIFGGDYS